MYYRSILNAKISTQRMPNTKASRGDDKIVVTLTLGTNSFPFYKDMRFVFHHDKVYITEFEYNKSIDGHKKDIIYFSKCQHPFDINRFGYTYRGERLDELALVDMALKLYTNMYLDINSNGRLSVYYYA